MDLLHRNPIFLNILLKNKQIIHHKDAFLHEICRDNQEKCEFGR